MLIEKIKTHNEVNGLIFSACEFAVIALTLLPFALYYLWHARVFSGIVVLGIVVNALTVVAFSMSALRAREKDIGFMSWFNRNGRAVIASRYPNLTRDTLTLTAAMLIPYSILVCSVYERLATQRGKN